MRNITNEFLKDVKKVLEDNISKLGHKVSGNHDSVIDGGALWAWSAAFKAFHKKDYLMEATQRKNYFIAHFLCASTGSPIVLCYKTKVSTLTKQVYAVTSETIP